MKRMTSTGEDAADTLRSSASIWIWDEPRCFCIVGQAAPPAMSINDGKRAACPTNHERRLHQTNPKTEPPLTSSKHQSLKRIRAGLPQNHLGSFRKPCNPLLPSPFLSKNRVDYTPISTPRPEQTPARQSATMRSALPLGYPDTAKTGVRLAMLRKTPTLFS